jgi:hypothetical protein
MAKMRKCVLTVAGIKNHNFVKNGWTSCERPETPVRSPDGAHVEDERVREFLTEADEANG